MLGVRGRKTIVSDLKDSETDQGFGDYECIMHFAKK